MNRRPLAPSFRRLFAAAVVLCFAGCAMFEPMERAAPSSVKESPPPDRDGDRIVDAPDEPVATGTEASGTKSGEKFHQKTTVDFTTESVNGELKKPDGEFVTATPVAKPPRPSSRSSGGQLAEGDGKKGGEGEDGFDSEFGNDKGANKKVSAYVPPEPPKVPAQDPSDQSRTVLVQKRVSTIQVIRGAEQKAEKNELTTKAPPERPVERERNTNPSDYLRHYGVNPTIETNDERFSTFSADVDTGSYSLARAYIQRGALPPEAAVRVEEFVNAFDYAYRAPEKEAFAVQVEAFPSPNRKGYHVLHLGLKGKEISAAARKPASLVFTLDVSGSMAQDNRLGLAKRALVLLLEQLDERDQVSLVVYGDAARIVLPPTNASQKEKIAAAIHSMRSEGSTNVQAGIELAYSVAMKAFKPDGVNRVILCSDGVANNGITHADGIFAKVKARASEGITLTTVGFGMDDYNDVLMERLADQGDGQYAYVDKLDEARRIFVEQLSGTLQVIAKDVKLQLEFNPEAVARYRLLGFENRALTKQDFHDDKKDAGEMGAGHAVTAVYEVKFKSRAPANFATFRARFKEPRGVTSGLVERPLPMSLVKDSVSASSGPARLSLVAAGFAEKLRGSYWARNLQWGELLELWETLPAGLKQQPRVEELHALLLSAKKLDRRPDRFENEMPVASMDFDRVPVLR